MSAIYSINEVMKNAQDSELQLENLKTRGYVGYIGRDCVRPNVNINIRLG